jgi:hypothetical protein
MWPTFTRLACGRGRLSLLSQWDRRQSAKLTAIIICMATLIEILGCFAACTVLQLSRRFLRRLDRSAIFLMIAQPTRRSLRSASRGRGCRVDGSGLGLPWGSRSKWSRRGLSTRSQSASMWRSAGWSYWDRPIEYHACACNAAPAWGRRACLFDLASSSTSGRVWPFRRPCGTALSLLLRRCIMRPYATAWSSHPLRDERTLTGKKRLRDGPNRQLVGEATTSVCCCRSGAL